MPWDVLTQRADTAAAKPFGILVPPQPDSERVKAAATLIAGSKAPMIFVGSGAIEAREEILELAELIDAFYVCGTVCSGNQDHASLVAPS